MTTLLILAGAGLLWIGADELVRGSVRLAVAARVPTIVVGLTVVAIGTSAPEAAVSIRSALAGQAGIALGNVVGSNIANILLILGLSAIISPLFVANRVVRRDLPIMVVVSALPLLLGLDGRISRVQAGLLLAGACVYIVGQVTSGRAGRSAAEERLGEPEHVGGWDWLILSLRIVVGLALLLLGAHWLVSGAVAIAAKLGVSQLVIGLTVVAVGTSLPELATSLMAVRHGNRDLAVGNVVGSNIFNILFVLGAAGVASSGGLRVSAAALSFDLPVMLAAAFACAPVFLTGRRIARLEGVIFVGYYGAYVLFLVLDATGHSALPILTAAMLGFVVPITAIGFAIALLREHRRVG